MAAIVYTNLYSLDELDSATWRTGDQNSYERTQALVEGFEGIKLIGRQDSAGRVQIVRVMARSGAWLPVNAWHMEIVRWFDQQLDSAPAGNTWAPFFDEIDSASVRDAVVQIVSAEYGSAPAIAEIEKGALGINALLRAFDLPAGDWSFLPILRALKSKMHAV